MPPVRPSRAWLWRAGGPDRSDSRRAGRSHHGLRLLAARAPTVAGFGTLEPVPGSGGARGDASGDPAAIRSVATALRGPVPDPERPPSRPVDPRPPRPPRDDGLPPAAGPPEAPRSVADAAGRRPAASMLSEARPGPDRPAAGAADSPAKDRRSLGRELFAREWLPDDPRCHGGDGLGPVYNAASCLACHNLGGPGGGGPAGQNVELATGIGYTLSPTGPMAILARLLGDDTRSDLVATDPELADMVRIHPGFRDARSTVLHRFGVDPAYSMWCATFRSQSRPVPPVPTDSSRRPGPRRARVGSPSRDQGPATRGAGSYLTDRQCRPLKPITAEDREGARVPRGAGAKGVAIAVTARNAPPLFGTGLIDRLADSELERVARRQPLAARGRVHRLKDGRIGRFGWKAQVASLEDFVLSACANELGLEVPGHHQAASPLDPAATARGLDLTRDDCEALVAYVRSLPPPVVLPPSEARGSAAVAEGRSRFHSIGCASCHTPNLGPIRGLYSDLLLHDMGEELSDPGSYDTDGADSRDAPKRGEWRTPPLWGFRDTAPYLHDGRARNLEEAVALHHGQGAASASQFRSMSDLERSQVETFLNSLERRPRRRAPDRRPASRLPGALISLFVTLVRFCSRRELHRPWQPFSPLRPNSIREVRPRRQRGESDSRDNPIKKCDSATNNPEYPRRTHTPCKMEIIYARKPDYAVRAVRGHRRSLPLLWRPSRRRAIFLRIQLCGDDGQRARV